MFTKILNWLFPLPEAKTPSFDYKTLSYVDKVFSVYFSPKGGCTEAIINYINKAENEILMQAYSFTSKDIATALILKKSIVKVIIDSKESVAKGCQLDNLKNSGIPVKIDSEHAIAHSKIIIIDKKTVLTGSFNYSKVANFSNADNLIIINNDKIAETYINNFNVHWGHSIY